MLVPFFLEQTQGADLMVFSSVIFLFRFLPLALAVYYIIPSRLKNTAVFIMSLLFYSWSEMRFIPLLLICTAVNFLLSLRAKKRYLIASMIFNISILAFFKYTDFLLENINLIFGTYLPVISISLPLGISFYTFQNMSYQIDVYRGNVLPEKNIISFGAYVTMFPQLIAGPIVRYSEISRELNNSRRISLTNIQEGILLFIMGLGSKVLIADNFDLLWTAVSEKGFSAVSTPLAWMGVLAFALQIYFDFSGYSLMAIGLGRMMGFHFPQNFNYPYISRSVTEFWRRWHMTLGQWFREYVYIPLGGSRCNSARQYLNIFIVWALTGLWHGASWNFVLWGLYFCVFLCIEKAFLLRHLEKIRVISHLYLLLLVVVSWALFAVEDFSQLWELLARMFIFSGGDDWVYYIRNYGATFIISASLATPLLKILRGKLGKIATWCFAAVILFLSTAYMVDATHSPFLYFRF